jgi:hypothetical protein
VGGLIFISSPHQGVLLDYLQASENHSTWTLPAILKAHLWFKALGTAAFTGLFFVAYFYLLKNPVRPVTTIPVTWVDQAIGFEAIALPFYLSLWVYVSLPPFFMSTRRAVTSYGLRIGLLCSAGLGIFYCYPNATPPANIDWALIPGMAFLKGVDAAGNACPSLHVATAIFSCAWLHWRFSALGFSPAWKSANFFWCVAIVYSTLATKQHVAIDVAGGIALSLVAVWCLRLKKHALQC